MNSRKSISNTRLCIILSCIIAGIILLPKILSVLIQVLLVIFIYTAITGCVLLTLRLTGVRVDLSNYVRKINCIFMREYKPYNQVKKNI